MEILLNGTERLSPSSTILQYMDEPFYRWCDKLPALLGQEIGQEFTLIYTGRNEEARILREQAKKVSDCKEFIYQKPEVDTVLPERMKELDTYVQNGQVKRVAAIDKKAFFIGKSDFLKNLEDKIRQLKLRNSYCQVQFGWLEEVDKNNLSAMDIPIYLVPNLEQAEKMAETEYFKSPYGFFLGIGEESGFRRVVNNRFVYEFSISDFVKVVYECLFLIPLAEGFASYMRELLRQEKQSAIYPKLLLLQAMKPLVQVRAQTSLEVGTKVPFQARTLPSHARVPEFFFHYQSPGIVECRQKEVIALREGRTQVEVYQKGGVEPIRILSFQVYTRNRIQKILLSENHVTKGVGDVFHLHCECFPEDADNKNTIQWSSTSPEIVSVDKNGKVQIRASGTCTILCTAEQGVQAACSVTGKFYLQDIKLPEWTQGEVRMKKGEQLTLGYTLVPQNALDGELMFASSNLLVVNVYDGVLEAIDDGEAEITVENITRTICKQFHVTVENPKRKKSLFGFFDR